VSSLGVLFPRFDHPAIEERYASWQSQMLLREGGLELAFYDPEEPASYAIDGIASEMVLVVTDPLLVPPARLAARLRDALALAPGAKAALPVSNEAENPAQRRPPAAPYLTLRELQEMTARMQARPRDDDRVKWDGSDPAAYLCHGSLLDECDEIPRRALAGREVVLSTNDYAHRWIPMRAELRSDLLPYIPADARSIIELGCGEAPLGAAIKARQKARVAGIELDPQAAAVARKRIDAVYNGDVRYVVSILDETFDVIIASEIIEHLDDPWSLLAELRRIATPGGRLIMSIPNVAHASLVGDLLAGRFDYTYIGLTCAGHLRFFTRRSLEEMLSIAGWRVESMTPQRVPSASAEELLRRLDAAGIAHAREELLATGYTVVARS
jgi:2-polyprenyl-3-methyl-5-hydroxy-6-metoxy-1,4-benzoquinol methylase